MTHLRKIMLEELERRNYAQATIDCYLRAVAEFSLHFHRPPNQLGPEHIRQYQAHLFGQRKLAPSTVTQRLAALRFFYIKTLRNPWSIAKIPCSRGPSSSSLLHVQSVHPFMVHCEALALQQDLEPPIAKPSPGRS